MGTTLLSRQSSHVFWCERRWNDVTVHRKARSVVDEVCKCGANARANICATLEDAPEYHCNSYRGGKSPDISHWKRNVPNVSSSAINGEYLHSCDHDWSITSRRPSLRPPSYPTYLRGCGSQSATDKRTPTDKRVAPDIDLTTPLPTRRRATPHLIHDRTHTRPMSPDHHSRLCLSPLSLILGFRPCLFFLISFIQVSVVFRRPFVYIVSPSWTPT